MTPVTGYEFSPLIYKFRAWVEEVKLFKID